MILLEQTAGQGTALGATFEQLASIIAMMNDHRRVGVCLDTCHLIASGYDLCSPEGYASTFTQFGRLVGFDRLKVFHMNDSKKPLGSRVDRHEHIGQGFLGLDPFRRIVNDRRFRGLPMLLETPKGDGKATGPIAGPQDIEVGRHGLVVESARQRGLLLPQVATEWHWDAESFLAHTCHKAGLPREAWKHGAKLWRFEAEVFGER